MRLINLIQMWGGNWKKPEKKIPWDKITFFRIKKFRGLRVAKNHQSSHFSINNSGQRIDTKI